MPNLDGTGFRGRGALTGRGLGTCRTRGTGQEMSFGFGRSNDRLFRNRRR